MTESPEANRPPWWHIASSLGLVAVTLSLAVVRVRSQDLFMYLALGRRMLANGELPAFDPFIFSMSDYAWHVNHEWLSYLVFYGLYEIGGIALVTIFKALAVLTLGVLVWQTARTRGLMPAFRDPLLFITILASASRFMERSSLFSDVFTAVVVAIALHARRQETRIVFLLPPIFLFWINLHPGYLPGLAFLAVVLGVDIRRYNEVSYRRLAGSTVVSAFALLANPLGLDGVLYPLTTVLSNSWEPYREYNLEWLPTLHPNFLGTTTVGCFVLLVILVLGLLWHRRKSKPLVELAGAVLFAGLGFSAIRFVSTAAWSLSLIAIELGSGAGSVQEHDTAVTGRLTRIHRVFAVGVGLFLAASLFTDMNAPRKIGLGVDTSWVPVEAANFIDEAQLTTPLFNDHGFGSYLAWAWDGRRKVFYHGFIDDLDFYQRDYISVLKHRADFERVVSTYEIGAFLLSSDAFDPDQPRPIAVRLLLDPEWVLVYADPAAFLVVKNIPENRGALAHASVETKQLERTLKKLTRELIERSP